ncbi:MAG TPA: recombination protein O N-terminal domain-containing protein, partial [Caulobacter sp.]|nr:recombination protein O N-terminal domain-containing protein [Caulobacter sp.]
MEWEDDAFVLSARPHGETGAIVELLTERRGRFAAHVAGGASRRMKPFLQAGAKVLVQYRARVEG